METNAEKYNFSDFTHRHYDEIIKEAQSNYSFKSYSKEVIDAKENIVIWRHDVDFSMHEALNLANIESKNGVLSTYFLLPHSEFYNLLELSIKEKVVEIIKLGHHIGLHFDPLFYNIKSESELIKHLAFEKNLIETIFNVEVKVFSFHNPTEEMLQFDNWEYAGMINTYAKDFKGVIDYCSDSNGYWRFRRLMDVVSVEKPEKLQVLTHPEWWTEKIMSPKEKVWRAIEKRAIKNKEFYVNGIIKYGREVID